MACLILITQCGCCALEIDNGLGNPHLLWPKDCHLDYRVVWWTVHVIDRACIHTVNNRRCSNNVVLFSNLLRCWPNISTALGQHVLPARYHHLNWPYITQLTYNSFHNMPYPILIYTEIYLATFIHPQTLYLLRMARWISILTSQIISLTPQTNILWNSMTMTSFVFTELANRGGVLYNLLFTEWRHCAWQNDVWEKGTYITLFSPSDVTAFHRMKYGGGGLI